MRSSLSINTNWYAGLYECVMNLVVPSLDSICSGSEPSCWCLGLIIRGPGGTGPHCITQSIIVKPRGGSHYSWGNKDPLPFKLCAAGARQDKGGSASHRFCTPNPQMLPLPLTTPSLGSFKLRSINCSLSRSKPMWNWGIPQNTEQV